MRLRLLIVLGGIIAMMAGCNNTSNTITVTEDEYGDQWGFTVSQLELGCEWRDGRGALKDRWFS